MANVAEKFKEQTGQFSNIKNVYCRNEMTFDLFYSGNIIKVQFEDGKMKRYGRFKQKPGMFLANLTNKVVKQRIESGDYVPRNTDPMRFRNNTIMYSSERIRENLFKPCVSVDIIGCYWQTAFNLGVIDEKTYLIGISKDREYKDARNIAIGSIGSLLTHEKYVKGKLISTEKSRKFGATSRLDVIDHVWAMANWIAQKLGPDFLMFLTDCFFVPEHRLKDLCNYIEEEGYKWKVEKCQFGEIRKMHTGINKKGDEIFTEKVIWYNIEKDQVKFHDFSHVHNVYFKIC
jgi:hypothetical protein